MNLIHTKILTSDRLYQAAYYYAEASLTQQVELLCNNMEVLYKDPEITSREYFLFKLLDTPIIPPDFRDYMGEMVKISISCEKNEAVSDIDELILVSKCTIGRITRSVKATIHVLWTDPREPTFSLNHTNFSIIGWEEI